MKKDLTSDWKAEKRFDLIYYDGLAKQQEEIRLSIGMYGEHAGYCCLADSRERTKKKNVSN